MANGVNNSAIFDYSFKRYPFMIISANFAT